MAEYPLRRPPSVFFNIKWKASVVFLYHEFLCLPASDYTVVIVLWAFLFSSFGTSLTFVFCYSREFCDAFSCFKLVLLNGWMAYRFPYNSSTIYFFFNFILCNFAVSLSYDIHLVLPYLKRPFDCSCTSTWNWRFIEFYHEHSHFLLLLSFISLVSCTFSVLSMYDCSYIYGFVSALCYNVKVLKDKKY